MYDREKVPKQPFRTMSIVNQYQGAHNMNIINIAHKKGG